MSYKYYHHYNLAMIGGHKNFESLKGFLLFLFIVFLIASPFIFTKQGSMEYGVETRPLFSCMEYNESYMTCSLGALK